MLSDRKVKIFESSSMQGLEDNINEWLECGRNEYVESIAYSASQDAYSALVYYHLLLDPHHTEPLEK